MLEIITVTITSCVVVLPIVEAFRNAKERRNRQGLRLGQALTGSRYIMDSMVNGRIAGK